MITFWENLMLDTFGNVRTDVLMGSTVLFLVMVCLAAAVVLSMVLTSIMAHVEAQDKPQSLPVIHDAQ